MYRFSCLLVLLLCANISAASSENLAEEQLFKKNIKSLSISMDEGSILIKGHKENNTKIRLVKASIDCKIKTEISNNILKIDNDKRKGGCSCDYEIYLPYTVKVDISLGSVPGIKKLAFYDLNSNIKFNLGSGDVLLHNVNGDIMANLGAGSIDYRPLQSKHVGVLEISAGTVVLNCLFPYGSTVKTLPKYSFMAKINSSVREVNDGTHNFVLSGAIGGGSIVNMDYSN